MWGRWLCSDTDEDIARYSILHGNEQLFASKYKLYLPSEEELKREIEKSNLATALPTGVCRSLYLTPNANIIACSKVSPGRRMVAG